MGPHSPSSPARFATPDVADLAWRHRCVKTGCQEDSILVQVTIYRRPRIGPRPIRSLRYIVTFTRKWAYAALQRKATITAYLSGVPYISSYTIHIIIKYYTWVPQVEPMQFLIVSYFINPCAFKFENIQQQYANIISKYSLYLRWTHRIKS